MFLDDLEEAVSLLKKGFANEATTPLGESILSLQTGLKTQKYLRELLTCVNSLRESETSSEALARLDSIHKSLLEVEHRVTDTLRRY